jgi:hypothetical protein
MQKRRSGQARIGAHFLSLYFAIRWIAAAMQAFLSHVFFEVFFFHTAISASEKPVERENRTDGPILSRDNPSRCLSEARP